jgi:hypothetical protein
LSITASLIEIRKSINNLVKLYHKLFSNKVSEMKVPTFISERVQKTLTFSNKVSEMKVRT